MAQRPFYYRQTDGIRITVRPVYLPERSQPLRAQFVFAYFVRIENVGGQSAQLRSRRWLIHDSIGEETVVEGEGVVGEQPILASGQVHEYQSFCVLKSPQGYMEGEYRFLRADGTGFNAAIPRFQLEGNESAEPLH
ncbi:MAG TPA: Co2+/Mg2+ efflux protein ApaG [Gemmatimonadales bacterium]|nr:Co2+/Mg2+ efflux protein ApaG [Gemmatimonadales bacterium]